jgi:hypothetical protein
VGRIEIEEGAAWLNLFSCMIVSELQQTVSSGAKAPCLSGLCYVAPKGATHKAFVVVEAETMKCDKEQPSAAKAARFGCGIGTAGSPAQT